MSNQSVSVLQFIRGQEICQIAFGMYLSDHSKPANGYHLKTGQ